MTKVLWGLSAAVVILIAAILVGPGFIDWNDYRDEARALVRDATGRELIIDGDISLRLLPSPAFSASDVRLANAEGGSTADMVTLSRLDVRIKAAPLLGGEIQIESVHLVDPVVVAERLADGRWNWRFEPPETTPAEAPVTGGGEDDGTATGGLGVRLDSFVIEDGVLILRDPAAGLEERIDGLDAEIKAASLNGPFDATGRLAARGVGLTFNGTTGRAIHGRTLPFNLELGLEDETARLRVSGTLRNLSETPAVKAKLALTGARLSDMARRLGIGGPLPGLLGAPFDLQTNVEASADGVRADDLRLAVGPLTADGTLAATLGDVPDVQATLTLGRIDLDSLLAMPPLPGGTAATSGTAGSIPGATAVVAPSSATGASEPTGTALPDDLDAGLEITIDALTYRQRSIRQARVRASLSGGALTVDQVSALLPGGGEAALFGFVNLPPEGPRFEGTADGMVADLREVMDWLGVAAPEVPADRLRKLNLTTQVVATADQIQLPGLDLTVDSSRLTGGVTIALRDRPAFGADLTLDRLNLDAYLPVAASSGDAAPVPDDDGASNAADTPRERQRPLPDLSVLDTFDANLTARVGQLTVRRRVARDVALDGTLYRGDLTLRRATVKDLAGASASLAGGIENLDGIPTFKDLRYDIGAADAGGLFDLLGVVPPMPPANLGRVSLIGHADGSALTPDLAFDLKAAGADLRVDGSVKLLSLMPGFDGTLRLTHDDLNNLLDRLDAGYRPAGRTGPLDLRTGIAARLDSTLTLSNMDIRVGDASARGKATVDFSAARPKVDADLTLAKLVLDSFLPATERRRAGPPSRRRFAGMERHVVAVLARPDGAPWSTDPIDLSALNTLDADVVLTANSLRYGDYLFETANLDAELRSGRLDASRLSGDLFGGTVSGRATVDAATGDPRVSLDLDIRDLDIAKALIAAQGKARGRGRIDLAARLAATGPSVAGLIGSLNGDGTLAVRGVDAEAGVETGLPLVGGVLRLARALDGGIGGLAKALGGQQGDGILDANGTFTVTDGRLSMNDLVLRTAAYQGNARVLVDLPAYVMDARGTLNLSRGPAGLLLSEVAEIPTAIPFEVSGPLDHPTTVRVDTGSLPGGKLTLPDKLGTGKTGEILQQILPGLLGGQATPPASGDGSETPPPPPPADADTLPPPPPPPGNAQGSASGQPRKPRDVLIDILRDVR